jgi:NAD(P)H-nitrite reductase large subunit
VLETIGWREYLKSSPSVIKALLAPEYLLKGLRLKIALKLKGIPTYQNVSELSAEATEKLISVNFRTGNKRKSLTASSLLLHEGVIPNTALTRQANLDHSWNKQQQAWQVDGDSWGHSSNPNILIAGDSAGIFGGKSAEYSGRITGIELAFQLNKINEKQRNNLARIHKLRRARDRSVRKMLDKLYPPSSLNSITTNETLVCRCYEVTRQQVVDSIDKGCESADQVKSYLRCGMGPCQGRMCGVTINQILSKELDQPMEKIKYFNIRPPIKPITLRELSSLGSKEVR